MEASSLSLSLPNRASACAPVSGDVRRSWRRQPFKMPLYIYIYIYIYILLLYIHTQYKWPNIAGVERRARDGVPQTGASKQPPYKIKWYISYNELYVNCNMLHYMMPYYIYIYIYIYILDSLSLSSLYIYIYIHVYVYVCMFMYLYIYIYIHMLCPSTEWPAEDAKHHPAGRCRPSLPEVICI